MAKSTRCVEKLEEIEMETLHVSFALWLDGDAVKTQREEPSQCKKTQKAFLRKIQRWSEVGKVLED